MPVLKKEFWTLLVVLIGLFLPSFPVLSLGIGDVIPPFRVLSHDDEPLTERDLLGTLSVIFYDTRHTAASNNDLKYTISEFREAQLPRLENLQVIQIIDASSANLLTRGIWERKLRQTAQKYNTPIYADWSGRMRRDFGFSTKKSNILVVDTRGVVRYFFSGKVPQSEQEKLLALLLALADGH